MSKKTKQNKKKHVFTLVYPGGFLNGQFPRQSVYPTASFGIFTHHNLSVYLTWIHARKKKKGEGMNQAELVVWKTPIIIKMSDFWKALSFVLFFERVYIFLFYITFCHCSFLAAPCQSSTSQHSLYLSLSPWAIPWDVC